MVFAEFDRRERRDAASRIRLFVQILTACGYAALGITFADPVLKTGQFGVTNAISLAVGLASLAYALYVVPKGDRYGPV